MKFSGTIALLSLSSVSAFSYLDSLSAPVAPAAPAASSASPEASTGNYLDVISGNTGPVKSLKPKPVAFASSSMNTYLESVGASSPPAAPADVATPAAPAPAAASGFEAFLKSQGQGLGV